MTGRCRIRSGMTGESTGDGGRENFVPGAVEGVA